MILDVLCIRNKSMKCFANPYFTQEKLENLETNFSRSMISSEELRIKYAHCALYHIGTFDDEKGKFDLLKEPELLFDCDDILNAIPKE